MTPEAIASLVLLMNPPIAVQGKSNIEIWRIRKAAEIGIMSVYASIISKTTIKDTWK